MTSGNFTSAAGTGAPTIALGVNDCWNIVNYRSGLVRSLQDAGHRIAVLAPAGPHCALLAQLGVDFLSVPISPRGKSPIADVRALAAFRRQLAACRPAAFLGFTAKPNIYGSLAAGSLGIPVINNISGLGAAFTRQSLLTRLVLALYKLALKRSATVFFQNRDDRALFERAGVVRPEQAALLPGSGIDLANFSPRPKTGGTAPFTFLFAGRLLWDKGVAQYVEAARRLQNSGVRFEILGIVEPPSAAAVPLEQLREWESERLIVYRGSLSDVREALGEADCVVLPSYYREGVPRVLLEASAMAIPVITADMPGCREAVEHGVTGFWCAPRSAESLAEAMARMLSLGSAEREQMGREGRLKMERDFDQEVVHRAYREALARCGVEPHLSPS